MPKATLTSRISKILQTKQGQAYAVAIGTAFIVVVLIGLGIFPIVSAILFASEQNGLKQEVLNRMIQKEQILNTLVGTEAANRNVSLALKAAMPDEVLQADFIKTVNDLTADNAIFVRVLTFNDIESRVELKELFDVAIDLQGKSATLSAYGTKEGLENFIVQLEQDRRVANIRNLIVSRRDSQELIESNFPTLEFKLDLQLEIYYIEKQNG